MHIEPPKVSMHSVKEFVSHYLMIVLSVLTALGLEAFLEHLHHVHAAEASQQAIEAELAENVAQIRSSMADNATRLAATQALDTRLTEEIRTGKPKAEIVAEIGSLARANQIDVGLFVPTTRHEAWDVAVANQSATWIDPVTLTRYARAYALQRQDESLPATRAIDFPRLVDSITDARIDNVEPAAFLRSIHQAAVSLKSLQSQLNALQETLLGALPADKAEAANKATPLPKLSALAASAASS
jgi:hypothetical protein